MEGKSRVRPVTQMKREPAGRTLWPLGSTLVTFSSLCPPGVSYAAGDLGEISDLHLKSSSGNSVLVWHSQVRWPLLRFRPPYKWEGGIYSHFCMDLWTRNWKARILVPDSNICLWNFDMPQFSLGLGLFICEIRGPVALNHGCKTKEALRTRQAWVSSQPHEVRTPAGGTWASIIFFFQPWGPEE